MNTALRNADVRQALVVDIVLLISCQTESTSRHGCQNRSKHLFTDSVTMFSANSSSSKQNGTNLWITHRTFITNWYIFMVLLCIAGSVFNLLLFIALKKPRKSLRGSQILIAHMILLDLTICAIANPLFVSSVFFTQFFPLNKTYCEVAGFLYVSCMSMENWLNLSLAINRTVALLYPTLYPKLTKKWGIFGLASLGWIGPISYFFASLDLTASFEPSPPWGACSLRPFPGFVHMYNFDMAFPLSSSGLIYVTAFVVYKVRVSRQVTVKSTGQNEPPLVHDRHVRTIKMLFVAYVWYLVCFLPSVMMAYVFIAHARSSVTASFYGRASTLFAYATNPVRPK